MTSAELFKQGFIKAAKRAGVPERNLGTLLKKADVISPQQASGIVRQKDTEREKQRMSSFPVKPLLGAGALAAGGAGGMYAGEKMHDFANLSFNDVQNWLNKKAPASFKPDFSEATDFIPNAKLKDFNNPDMTETNQAISNTINAQDSLESELQYANAGHRLLSTKYFGNEPGVNLQHWLRSPSNSWWRTFVPSQGDVWKDNPNSHEAMHYTSFYNGVGNGFNRIMDENEYSTYKGIGDLADTRKKVLAGIMSGADRPIDKQTVMDLYNEKMLNAATSKFTEPYYGMFSSFELPKDEGHGVPGMLASTIGTLPSNSVFKNKQETSLKSILGALEQRLPPELQAQSLLKQDPSGGYDLSKLKGDFTSPVYSAFGMSNYNPAEEFDSKNFAPVRQQLADKVTKLIADHPGLDPSQQTQLIYSTLKEDPLAQMFGVAALKELPAPVAAPFYKGISTAVTTPGKAAVMADHASPWFKGVGLAAGAAGLGYGGYRFMKWLKDRRDYKRYMQEQAT